MDVFEHNLFLLLSKKGYLVLPPLSGLESPFAHPPPRLFTLYSGVFSLVFSDKSEKDHLAGEYLRASFLAKRSEYEVVAPTVLVIYGLHMVAQFRSSLF